ncbi:hypothetical protein [Streptomyces sp. NBC_01264]|uniref:hypothetical protein n=1 Tax=Streptomyces sp. NBC_01264 TaxID=2903804 RepID=UPI002254E40B|nr:hypothetical protein [Streptomyces sp. NBC_01264]MCX4784297.1 hypothetical protein [Streptomyces sp. NBC_01264]
MTGDETQFVVAGKDIGPFVLRWLAEVDPLDNTSDSLLQHAVQERDPRQQGFYGSAYVMSKIAPRVWGDQGTDDELLMFAVIATYKRSKPHGWEGVRAHTEQAFAYMRKVGEVEAARRLRAEVAKEASDEAVSAQKAFHQRMDISPLSPMAQAAHDQEMAQGSHRDLRAADALDPRGTTAF